MTMTRHRQSLRTAIAATVGAALLWALGWTAAPSVRATTTILVNTVNQEINGDGFCSLQEAIYAANLDDSIAPDAANPGQFFDTACPGGSGHDVIELPPMGVFQFSDPITDPANFMGPTATPIITSDITIEGRGARLERLAAGRLTRAFAVGAAGFLDLREVHIKNFSIHGGDGGAGGGGGGMGAGGAIYVQAGRLLVQWTTFEGNAVRGGDGGDHASVDGGGGGGGLSGDGGAAHFSGGGGGGARGNGGDARADSGDYWGGGGGGLVTSGSNEIPGQPCGGAGGESGFGVGGDGDGATCPGGGGGGGSATSDVFPGDGGAGSYGGGGGGGGGGGAGSDGGFGGGGGGGGGGSTYTGGDGGFGGGGGQDDGLGLSDGQGGTFAGDASREAGGGGAGLGGAIFGYLADIRISNSTFFGNEAAQGQGGISCGTFGCGQGANDGRGAGGAIFTVAGVLTVESSTLSGNSTTTVTDGGGGAIVVYDPIGSDEEASLVLRNTIIAGNGTSECYTRNGVTTSGSDGNIITDSSPNNLGNPACPGVDSAADPGLGQLQMNAPGRTPTMAIPVDSFAVNHAVGSSPLDDQRGVARPQGGGADIGAYEFEATAALPPVSTIALTPSTPNGSNGWYTSSVGVSVTATDFDGDLVETRCALDPTSVPAAFGDIPAGCSVIGAASDGHHAIYAASRDAADNIESPVVSASLKIDATNPSLAPSLNVSNVVIGQTGVVASANATDATSGVATQACGTVDTSTPGVHSLTCDATDHAGNSASTSLTYVVEYRILGFYSPVPYSRWRAGQTVPIKIGLGDAAGNRISDAAASALAAACRITFVATGAQASSAQCLKYDAAMDQFLFNWKLRKSPLGATQISVRISYPGSSTVSSLGESILIVR